MVQAMPPVVPGSRGYMSPVKSCSSSGKSSSDTRWPGRRHGGCGGRPCTPSPASETGGMVGKHTCCTASNGFAGCHDGVNLGRKAVLRAVRCWCLGRLKAVRTKAAAAFPLAERGCCAACTSSAADQHICWEQGVFGGMCRRERPGAMPTLQCLVSRILPLGIDGVCGIEVQGFKSGVDIADVLADGQILYTGMAGKCVDSFARWESDAHEFQVLGR